MTDMERDLRDMMQRTADGVNHVPLPSPGLVRRARLRRIRTATLVGATACLLVIGGFAGARSLTSDEALPPAEQVPNTESSGRMWWPQSSLEEARRAQQLADAGDPRYTWQVFPDLFDDDGRPAVGPGDVELFTRFLQERLGWEEFSWGVGPGLYPPESWPNEFVVVRCEPGATNALYPNDPDGRECAPTLDENRYETVRIRAASRPYSVAKSRPSAIWLVTRWEMLEPSDAPVLGIEVFRHQIQQVEPPSVAQATEFARDFLQARVDGEGAHRYYEDEDFSPLLYTSFSGAPYERFELELVRGPVWPGGWFKFKVRWFPEGEPVWVEKLFVERRGDRLGVFGIGSSDDEIAYGNL